MKRDAHVREYTVHSTCTGTSAHMYSRLEKERGELHVQYM